uniref:Coiled-coil domain containing 106a n=1 Tax=Astatotilapia calliptera TaxID=8154 RepID=A0A3P8PGD4_ASTCA
MEQKIKICVRLRLTQLAHVRRDTKNSSSNPAPTATALLNKEREKRTFLKEKLEWQKKRIEELEGERDFLRSQLSSLTKQPKDEPFNDPFSSKASENSDSSFASSSVSSVWSSSSSSPKKRKHKYNKKHSKFALFSFLVQTPNDIVQRYKSLLKTFPKTKTMTKAFQKHGLDRNTVVSTSSVGELAIAVPNVYQELLSNRPSGETVLAFAKRCEAAIQGSDEVKNKIESMKAAGTLLPIQRGKSV